MYDVWLYGRNTILKWVSTMSKPKKKVIAETYLDVKKDKTFLVIK